MKNLKKINILSFLACTASQAMEMDFSEPSSLTLSTAESSSVDTAFSDIEGVSSQENTSSEESMSGEGYLLIRIPFSQDHLPHGSVLAPRGASTTPRKGFTLKPFVLEEGRFVYFHIPNPPSNERHVPRHNPRVSRKLTYSSESSEG